MRLGVKSLQIIDTLFEQLGLFLGPVFHRLKGRTVAQCFLRDVLIVDLNVAFDGIGEVLAGRFRCGASGSDMRDRCPPP